MKKIIYIKMDPVSLILGGWKLFTRPTSWNAHLLLLHVALQRASSLCVQISQGRRGVHRQVRDGLLELGIGLEPPRGGEGAGLVGGEGEHGLHLFFEALKKKKSITLATT